MDDIEFNTIELEKFMVGAETAITKELLNDFAIPPDVRVSMYERFWQDAIVVQVRQAVYGEELQEIKYPADWWQAFKERWFKPWMLKRWPVKHRCYSVRAFYPKVSAPDLTHTVQLLRMTSS